jgi:hypothetical protein
LYESWVPLFFSVASFIDVCDTHAHHRHNDRNAKSPPASSLRPFFSIDISAIGFLALFFFEEKEEATAPSAREPTIVTDGRDDNKNTR